MCEAVKQVNAANVKPSCTFGFYKTNQDFIQWQGMESKNDFK